MLVLFLPVFFGMPQLYIWAQPDMVAADPILAIQAALSEPGFFTVRASSISPSGF